MIRMLSASVLAFIAFMYVDANAFADRAAADAALGNMNQANTTVDDDHQAADSEYVSAEYIYGQLHNAKSDWTAAQVKIYTDYIAAGNSYITSGNRCYNTGSPLEESGDSDNGTGHTCYEMMNWDGAVYWFDKAKGEYEAADSPNGFAAAYYYYQQAYLNYAAAQQFYNNTQ